MSKWEEFEKDCCKYLKNNFSTYANFEEMGRKNSNVSDIKVVLNNGKEFYIETKKPSEGNFAWVFAQFFYPIFLADFHHT